MPQNPRLWCADCGAPMHQSKGSLPQGLARCHPCRRASTVNGFDGRLARLHDCIGCGKQFQGVRRKGKTFCTIQCANQHHNAQRRIRDVSDGRVRRFQREQAAPGLNRRDRDQLLAKWKRQQRRCYYCPRPATTVDHVVSLVRGGTNYEGNLVPCCKACNSGKAGWLLVEWKTGRRLAPMSAPLHWSPRKPRTKKPRHLVAVQQEELRLCPICDALHDRPIYCSARCCSTANERRKTARNRKPPRTACPQGHPYTTENRRTRIRVRDGIERIETDCRPCENERKRHAA